MLNKITNTFLLQVVPTITNLFRKYPQLYNTTSVCSFYPQVVYQVRFLSLSSILCSCVHSIFLQVKRADHGIITGHTWHSVFITYFDHTRTKRRHVGWFKQTAADIIERLYLWSLHTWLWKWTGVNLVLAHHTQVNK